MEVNRDEALRCLDIGRRHLNSGNYASARKFGGKSIALFPTPEAKAFMTKVDQEEATGGGGGGGASPTSSSTSSTFTSSNPSSTKSSPNPGYSAASSSANPNRPNSVPPRPRSTPVDHKPVERDYTPEQVAAVKAIRSSGGDFYKVLGISKDASDSEIKKAYRKLALQMHPDKNGAPGADEAFKIVSKAFTVLSDPQKRAIFDQHGPETGKGSGVNYDRAQPAGHGFGGMHGGGMGGFGEEISPEELFNMFFGGQNAFGGSFHSATFAGPGFGARQFGGARQRTQQTQHRQQRQQGGHGRQQQQQEAGGTSGIASLIQILPLILLFLMSMLSSFFSDSGDGSSSSSGGAGSAGLSAAAQDFSLGPHGTYTTARFTHDRQVPYFVNDRKFRTVFLDGMGTPAGKAGVSGASRHVINQNLKEVHGHRVGVIFEQLERNVEATYLKAMRAECAEERKRKELALNRAQGFFGPNMKMYNAALRMATPSCDVIREKYGESFVA